MRSIVWSLMSVAALALAGCNSSNSPQQNAESAPKPVATKVTGTVALREGTKQPSDSAKLDISLVDISQHGSAPLASKTVQPATSFPQQFELDFQPDKINPNDLYVVQAVLTDGDRHYSMPLQAPVLTKGNKSEVSIRLVAEQTPSEKILADFTAEQKQLGAMQVSHGTKLEKDASRGWQLFRKDGEVKFIRELVDYGDKGFTSTDFAYKDGKPWVVVQQKKASKAGKTISTDRAGWVDNGTLVLKQHQTGSDVQALDADTAASLKKQATSILSQATGGKNK